MKEYQAASKMLSIIKNTSLVVAVILFLYFSFNAVKIYNYSLNYSEKLSDVAIVLGAGTKNGELSPIFRERINHSLYLFNEKKVRKIILTGGYGENQLQADSEIAKAYLQTQGLPEEMLLSESRSRYTRENLKEAKQIMDSLGLELALIVTDPLHMKRSMDFAKELNINCQPSATKTSMYRSRIPKLKSLMYETFYYSLGKIGEMFQRSDKQNAVSTALQNAAEPTSDHATPSLEVKISEP